MRVQVSFVTLADVLPLTTGRCFSRYLPAFVNQTVSAVLQLVVACFLHHCRMQRCSSHHSMLLLQSPLSRSSILGSSPAMSHVSGAATMLHYMDPTVLLPSSWRCGFPFHRNHVVTLLLPFNVRLKNPETTDILLIDLMSHRPFFSVQRDTNGQLEVSLKKCRCWRSSAVTRKVVWRSTDIQEHIKRS